jgi:hypothetical protein
MRIRRPSHATVVAYLALFVALGGTALASVIITSNSQVAKGTISGHQPPTGKHPNIIAGSINGQDVANDSLAPADIADVKFLRSAGPFAIDDTNPNTGVPTIQDLGLYGGIQLRGDCNIDASGNATARVTATTPTLSSPPIDVHSNGFNGSTDAKNVGFPAVAPLVRVGPTNVAHFFAGDFALTNGSDQLAGEAFAGTERFGHDCVFGVTVLG